MDIQRLQTNLNSIWDRISQAARRAGRAPASVRLLPVTKTVDVQTIRQLMDSGCDTFGESRIQDAGPKIQALPGAHFEMIGHLQRNKIKPALELFSYFHSIDSLRLAEALNIQAEKMGRTVRGLLEVNVSGETAKSGFAPDELRTCLAQLAGFKNLHIKGLMTMAPVADDPQDVRYVFRGLRELARELARMGLASIEMKELSMGMTHDFEIAIEEGATIVRIGSALFE